MSSAENMRTVRGLLFFCVLLMVKKSAAVDTSSRVGVPAELAALGEFVFVRAQFFLHYGGGRRGCVEEGFALPDFDEHGRNRFPRLFAQRFRLLFVEGYIGPDFLDNGAVYCKRHRVRYSHIFELVQKRRTRGGLVQCLGGVARGDSLYVRARHIAGPSGENLVAVGVDALPEYYFERECDVVENILAIFCVGVFEKRFDVVGVYGQPRGVSEPRRQGLAYFGALRSRRAVVFGAAFVKHRRENLHRALRLLHGFGVDFVERGYPLRDLVALGLRLEVARIGKFKGGDEVHLRNLVGEHLRDYGRLVCETYRVHGKRHRKYRRHCGRELPFFPASGDSVRLFELSSRAFGSVFFNAVEHLLPPFGRFRRRRLFLSRAGASPRRRRQNGNALSPGYSPEF